MATGSGTVKPFFSIAKCDADHTRIAEHFATVAFRKAAEPSMQGSLWIVARIMWNYVDSKGLSCVLSWHGKVCTIGRATTVRKLRKWLSTAQGAGYGNTPANRARQGWQRSVDRNCKCWWFTMGVCQILLFLIWVGWTPIHKSQLFWCELQGYVRFWPNATLSDWRNRWMSLSPGYWSSKIWSPHHKRLLQGVAEHFETQFW